MQTSREPRAVLITSDLPRHRFVANKLARALNLTGIVTEAKAPAVLAPVAPSPTEQAIFDQHFAERTAVEQRFFGTAPHFPDTAVCAVAHGSSNSLPVFEWVQARQPDVVLLYGSSIIKAPLLEHYDGRIINLHLGLSPYYRGSGTNFWPLVYREPECVGATIHLAVLRVDAGAILAQVRPPAEATDRAHELGVKTILAALAAMPDIIQSYLSGQLTPQTQRLDTGRVFKQKDFNAAAVQTMWQHFASGMMPEFLAESAARYARFPIVHAETVNS
jgi:methionyl-tRNA formyltransferase